MWSKDGGGASGCAGSGSRIEELVCRIVVEVFARGHLVGSHIDYVAPDGASLRINHNVACGFDDAEDLPMPIGPSSHFFSHGGCAIKPTLPEVDAVQPSGRVNRRIDWSPEGRINFLGFFSAQPWNKESWHLMTSLRPQPAPNCAYLSVNCDMLQRNNTRSRGIQSGLKTHNQGQSI
jgi:hypothetical protein